VNAKTDKNGCNKLSVVKLFKGKLPENKRDYSFTLKDRCSCKNWKEGESLLMGPATMFANHEVNLDDLSIVVPYNASEKFECDKMMRDESESVTSEQSRRSQCKIG